MMHLLRILSTLALLSASAQAQEDEDDPKSAPRHAATKSSAKPAAPTAPKAAKPEPTKPDAAAPVAVKKTHTDDPPAAARKSEPGNKPAAVDPNPAPSSARKPADDPAARKADAKRAAAVDPKVGVASPLEPAPANPRAVRVRLVDGSTVVGSVRAEQPESLVIDCALGQLAIPRARISTLAYDAAAGVGKRAPVQLLDDGETLPKKRPAP